LEIKGLREAYDAISAQEGFILTIDQEEQITKKHKVLTASLAVAP